MKPERKLAEVGKRLQHLRRQAGYTSYENFAVANELNRMTVYRAEAGKAINLKTLIIILDKLDVTMEEFFTGL